MYTLTHSHTHSLTYTLANSPGHSLIQSLTYSLTHSLTHSLGRPITRSLTHSVPHSLILSLSPSLTHSTFSIILYVSQGRSDIFFNPRLTGTRKSVCCWPINFCLFETKQNSTWLRYSSLEPLTISPALLAISPDPPAIIPRTASH